MSIEGVAVEKEDVAQPIVDGQEEVAEQVAEEPKKEDFETEEEYAVAIENHKAANLEPWQKVEDESETVPAGTHIRMKDKLKGRVSEQKDEIEKLRQEIEALKNSKKATAPATLKRPREDDFKDEYGEVDQEQYEAALDQYEHASAKARYDKVEFERKQNEAFAKARQELDRAVDGHYERAAKLIQDSGIKQEIYKEADLKIRKAVDAIMPKQGDIIVEQLISYIGEGSEKVMFYIGRNKAVLNEFMSLLTEDKTGMKAGVFLGQQKERLTNPKKITTRAPAPSPSVDGDAQPTVKGAALKRKYDEAHRKRNGQAAYNAKKEARLAGIDTSKW